MSSNHLKTIYFFISRAAEANTNANNSALLAFLESCGQLSKLGRMTPTRGLERTRLDAGEGGLEEVDRVGVDHRLMPLLVRDYLPSVDQLVGLGPADPEVFQTLFERDQPSTRCRHLLRLARHLRILSPQLKYSRRRARLNA
jgi:hypothetical protein